MVESGEDKYGAEKFSGSGRMHRTAELKEKPLHRAAFTYIDQHPPFSMAITGRFCPLW